MKHFLIFLLLLLKFCCVARSIHRPKDPLMPEITVYWKDDNKKKYNLRYSHLEEYPYFKIFNKEDFTKYTLPNESVTPRYTLSQINVADIKQTIEHLILEILQNKKEYTDFTILKNSDFNKSEKCGSLILKFKKYPFILKLFFENPQSLVQPFNKGIEPCFFFYMGGGINRHMTGFTRLRNRELLEKKLKTLPQWQGKIEFPRKWFFIPSSNRWICMEGSNLGNKKYQYIEIPSIYAIIADAIIPERVFSLYNKEDKKIALQITNDFDLMIDANISNFMIDHKTKKIVAIDTEHFPSLVGIKEKKKFDSYTEWYFYLAKKCVINTMFTTKKERRLAQKNTQNLLS